MPRTKTRWHTPVSNVIISHHLWLTHNQLPPACCPFRRLWSESGCSGLAYGYTYSGCHSVLNALLLPLPTLNWPFSLYKDGVHTDHFLCIKMESRLTILFIKLEPTLTLLYVSKCSPDWPLSVLTWSPDWPFSLSVSTWSPDWPYCLYQHGVQTDHCVYITVRPRLTLKVRSETQQATVNA